MPYLGYLLAQAVKAGQTVASAITSASSYAVSVGTSVMSLKPSQTDFKGLGVASPFINDGLDTTIPAINGSDMTISCWVYLGGGGSNIRAVWASQEGIGYGYQYLYVIANAPQFLSMWGTGGTAGSYVYAGTNTAIDNKWIHVTCVHTTATNYVYIDGELNASNTGGTTTGATSTYKIGAYGLITTSPLNGNVSNWAMWRRALSAEEIKNIMFKSYEDLTTSETSGLVSYYKLDDLAGGTFADSHGGNNGTY